MGIEYTVGFAVIVAAESHETVDDVVYIVAVVSYCDPVVVLLHKTHWAIVTVTVMVNIRVFAMMKNVKT